MRGHQAYVPFSQGDEITGGRVRERRAVRGQWTQAAARAIVPWGRRPLPCENTAQVRLLVLGCRSVDACNVCFYFARLGIVIAFWPLAGLQNKAITQFRRGVGLRAPFRTLHMACGAPSVA